MVCQCHSCIIICKSYVDGMFDMYIIVAPGRLPQPGLSRATVTHGSFKFRPRLFKFCRCTSTRIRPFDRPRMAGPDLQDRYCRDGGSQLLVLLIRVPWRGPARCARPTVSDRDTRIWNPIHLVHVGTYRYVPTCTDLYYDIVCTGTYYLRNVA
jgi:hypothetical protein